MEKNKQQLEELKTQADAFKIVLEVISRATFAGAGAKTVSVTMTCLEGLEEQIKQSIVSLSTEVVNDNT